eukprot:CFRG7353T1
MTSHDGHVSNVLLLTGAVGDYVNCKYDQELVKRGMKSVIVHPFSFSYCNQGKVRAIFQVSANEHSAIIITSKRAASVLEEVMLSLNSDLDDHKHLPVYVVGPATSTIVESLGFTDIRGRESGSAASLATILEEHIRTNVLCPQKPIVFLCGDKRREDIPQTLSALEVPATVLTVYSTGCNANLDSNLSDTLAQTQIHWAVFFSPSTVEYCLSSLLQLDNNIRLAAIGPTTAERMKDFGVSVEAVSKSPTPSCLAETLRQEQL